MQEAFVEFVGRLDPAELEARFERAARRGKLRSGGKAQAWELYADFYRNLVEKPAEHMPHTFVEAFSIAYREALKKKPELIRSSPDRHAATDARRSKRMLPEELNATPLGPREHWPQSLRAAYTLCFDTPLPACLVWGPERIQLPNPRYPSIHATDDASRPGRDFAVAWPETLAPRSRRRSTRALAGRGSCIDLRRSPDARSKLTLSLTPIRNEAGIAAGVLIIAIDAAADNDVQRLSDDLETLHYLVAHDLHSPLRTMQEIAHIVSNGSATQLPGRDPPVRCSTSGKASPNWLRKPMASCGLRG